MVGGRLHERSAFAGGDVERGDAAGERHEVDPREAGENGRYTERYTSSTYRQAVVRAAERASVRPWTPHQLRHARATEIRQKHGLEAAQAALGHGHIDTTQIYSSKLLELAKTIARDMG
jgi:integrase